MRKLPLFPDYVHKPFSPSEKDVSSYASKATHEDMEHSAFDTPEKFGRAMATIHHPLMNSFREAAHAYTRYEHNTINRDIHGERSRAISSGMDHPIFHLGDKTITHTYVYNQDAGPMVKKDHPIAKMRLGQKLISPRFISSSFSKKAVLKWAMDGNAMDDGRALIVSWHLPKGFNKGADVQHISKYPEEKEFLLKHSTPFRLFHKETLPIRHKDRRENEIKGVHIFHMEPT